MNVHPIRNSSLQDSNTFVPNPLLEGLKLASSENELLKLMAKDPFRNALWRQHNHEMDLFRTYMQQVVVPTKIMLSGGLAIHRILKTSLYQQNPNLFNSRKQYYMTGHSLASIDFVRGIHEGLVFEGITGVGKSHLLHSSLLTIPQCIERTNIRGIDRVTQINWIYIDLTSVASVEALAHRIVEAVDSILQSNGEIYDLTFRGIRSAQAKMEAAIRLLKTHFCGIVVIDEIQHENFAVSTAAPMRAWILRLANVGIGLVFCGNPLGFRLSLPKKPKSEEHHSTQIMRRLFSSDNIRLDPAPSYNDPEWARFTKGINRCRLVGEAHPYDKDLESLKFSLTGGFQDFYVELHCSIERILSNNPKIKVDGELVKLAASKSSKLRKMAPLVTAFSQRDSMALRHCADVDYEYYQSLWGLGSNTECSSEPAGPVNIVGTPSNRADFAKSLADDKELAKRRSERSKKKEEEKPNPTAAAVRNHHLEGLDNIISGKAKKSDGTKE